jgi:hypothetical protein
MVRAFGPDDAQVQPSPLADLKGGPEALRPYVGKVVALIDGEVRVSGSWAEVLEAIKAFKGQRAKLLYVTAGHLVA